MLSQLVLLMAIVAGVTFAGHLRRGDPSQRGYVIVLAGVTLAAVVAALRGDRFLSVVAVAFSLLVVAVPWVLDLLVRACFHRERLAWAVRLSALRTMLMIGAGLHRQQAILHGLLLLERRGVDGALAYFRELAQATEDDVELRVIHEQIVWMLLLGQRWNEGIAHYEARFPPRHAAGRPPLALELLRAYGESGLLGNAAGLLRAIEELLGRDPRAVGVVSHARLTFLAYVGHADEVGSALTDERRRRLGLSAAKGALLRGVALARAGRAHAAEVELRRVEDLAGARDDRVVHASRNVLARVPEPAIELEPELRSYAERVADRLEGYLSATPLVRRAGMLMATPVLLVLLVLGYAATLGWGGGGAGLLRMGAATPELVRAGSWGRVFTGMLVQTEPLALLLSVYGLWLAGPLVERIYGRGRTLVVTLGAGAAGLCATTLLEPEPAAVIGGGVLLTTGVVTGMLLVLLSPRTNLPRRTRRVLALPLVLLLLALAVMIPRSGTGLDVSLVGMVVAAAVGMLGLGLGAPLGRASAVLRAGGALLALAMPVACAFVALEDPQAFMLEHRRTVAAEGMRLRVPARFAVVEATPAAEEAASDPHAGPWPLQPGLHDTLAQRVGHRVQLLVMPTPTDAAAPSALLRVDPELGRAFVEVPAPPPEAFVRAWQHASETDEAALRSTILRRNGHDVGVVLERALGHGVSVVLVASPPEALVHDATLYAVILAEAGSGMAEAG